MRRTGHRPLARHEVSPARRAGLRDRRSACVAVVRHGAGHQLAGRRRSPRVAIAVLRRRLHDAAQAPHRRRTSSGAARPGCMPVLIGWAAVTGSLAWAAGRPVRGRLLLDAAALLGAGDPLPRRLRRAPACRCCRSSPRAERGRPRDRRLHLADRRCLAGAVAARHRLGLRRARPSSSARSSSGTPTGYAHDVRAGGRISSLRLFRWSNTYLSLLFLALAVDALVLH